MKATHVLAVDAEIFEQVDRYSCPFITIAKDRGPFVPGDRVNLHRMDAFGTIDRANPTLDREIEYVVPASSLRAIDPRFVGLALCPIGWTQTELTF
ncbi:MAG: hypothetical protein AAFR16_05875 [Pseudomonadota bacterium]